MIQFPSGPKLTETCDKIISQTEDSKDVMLMEIVKANTQLQEQQKKNQKVFSEIMESKENRIGALQAEVVIKNNSIAVLESSQNQAALLHAAEVGSLKEHLKESKAENAAQAVEIAELKAKISQLAAQIDAQMQAELLKKKRREEVLRSH